jgi:hypothetical protein
VTAANDVCVAAAIDMGQVVARYEKQCAGGAKTAIQSESSHQETDQKPQEKHVQKKSVCAEGSLSLDERRTKIDAVQARPDWARLLEEVSRECK